MFEDQKSKDSSNCFDNWNKSVSLKYSLKLKRLINPNHLAPSRSLTSPVFTMMMKTVHGFIEYFKHLDWRLLERYTYF